MQKDFVEQIIKFNAQTAGRDKFCRLVQYLSKLINWYFVKLELNKDLTDRFKNLETALSQTRKVLRLGKSVDFIIGALKSLHLKDPVLRWTITASKINQAFFLLFDHVIWSGKIGLFNIDKNRWAVLSSRFWFFSLLLNVARDIYGIHLAVIQEFQSRDSKLKKSGYQNGDIAQKERTSFVPSNLQVISKCVFENKPLFLDLIKNSCDLFLPLNVLEKFPTSAGFQGVVGSISSYVGLITVWNPVLKLVPS